MSVPLAVLSAVLGCAPSPAVTAAPGRVWRLHGWCVGATWLSWTLDMTWCSNASSSSPMELYKIQSTANPLLLTHRWREKLLISLLASSRKYVCCAVLCCAGCDCGWCDDCSVMLHGWGGTWHGALWAAEPHTAIHSYTQLHITTAGHGTEQGANG